MISSNNAPALENALHRELHRVRVNKINRRKEFFNSNIDTIYQIVKKHHGEVQYIADANALDYRQSLLTVDEDEEFMETIYTKLNTDTNNQLSSE